MLTLEQLRNARDAAINCVRSGEAGRLNCLFWFGALHGENPDVEHIAAKMLDQQAISQRVQQRWEEAATVDVLDAVLLANDEETPAVVMERQFATALEAAGQCVLPHTRYSEMDFDAADVDGMLGLLKVIVNLPWYDSSSIEARLQREYRATLKCIDGKGETKPVVAETQGRESEMPVASLEAMAEKPLMSANSMGVGANRSPLFPEGDEGLSQDIKDLALHLDTHRNKGKSDRQLALEFTGEKTFKRSKASSLLSTIQRHVRYDRINLPKRQQ